VTGVAIVAIPRADDPVWKYSSEKVPHMTLLFLGEILTNTELYGAALYLQHIAKTSMRPFDMFVDHRGPLGPDNADVLFFGEDRHNKAIPNAAINFLLADDTIKKAYSSIEQYPKWTPHLTMGYTKTPAKPLDREHELSFVQFDRVALWTGEYDGPEFRLEYPITEGVDMVMADQTTDFLQHFGVKGMKWGVRSANEKYGFSKQTGKDLVTKGYVGAVQAKHDRVNTRRVAEGKTELNAWGFPKKNKNVPKVKRQKRPVIDEESMNNITKAEADFHKFALENGAYYVNFLGNPKLDKNGNKIYVKHTDAEGFLAHHGVKGMKWGTRHDVGHEGEQIKTKKLDKLDKQYDKSFNGLAGYANMNNKLPGLNAKYEKTNLNLWKPTAENKATNEAYLKDYESVVEESLNGAMHDLGTNASGTRRLKLTRVGSGVDTWWSAGPEELKVKHADGDGRYKITPIFDKSGKIKGQKVSPLDESVAHVDADDFLEHFGVKGMHWGQRKSEPVKVNTRAVTVKKTLPKEGQAFALTAKGKYQRNNADTAVTVYARPGQRLSTRGGSNRKASEDAVRAAAARRVAQSSTTDALATKDLKALVERMNLEQQYAKLTVPTPTRTQKFISQLLGTGGQVAQQHLKGIANERVSDYTLAKGMRKETENEINRREKAEAAARKKAAGN
jgi:2'-5' RNA ligase